jgi:putative tricarboxylic transport membrane protein
VLSGGDLAPFFTRPISAVIAFVTIASILWSVPAFSNRVSALLRRRPKVAAGSVP